MKNVWELRLDSVYLPGWAMFAVPHTVITARRHSLAQEVAARRPSEPPKKKGAPAELEQLANRHGVR